MLKLVFELSRSPFHTALLFWMCSYSSLRPLFVQMHLSISEQMWLFRLYSKSKYCMFQSLFWMRTPSTLLFVWSARWRYFKLGILFLICVLYLHLIIPGKGCIDVNFHLTLMHCFVFFNLAKSCKAERLSKSIHDWLTQLWRRFEEKWYVVLRARAHHTLTLYIRVYCM